VLTRRIDPQLERAELAAKAAVVAVTPATEAVATTAMTRRAVLGMVEMYFMMVVPLWPGIRCLRRPSAL
jgi:hypothetical protein